MNGLYKDALGVYNVKIRKSLKGVKQGSSSRCFGLGALALNDSNFFHGIDADVKSSCCEHILANN